jgi:hypothetical protein
MGLYQHPHLIRGVVHTPIGAFTVKRGIVELPDDMGESLGWEPVTPDTGWSTTGEAQRDGQRRSVPLESPMTQSR